jgi:hypothetical protein
VSIYADSLKSLPPSMQDLCTLEDLDLRGAGQLQSLPHLPSSLKKLDLSGCHPELEKKITEHGNPEWNKIAHVPFVRIGTSHPHLLNLLFGSLYCWNMLIYDLVMN